MNTTDSAKNKNRLIVQKYGGATLATPEKIKQVARRIADLHQQGTQVVAVVSAMGKTTNELIELAHKVSAQPQLRELDMLLTVGERISMSLLSMALNDLGCPAISFTGSQAGILTTDAHINAQIIDVKAFRVEDALKKNQVVILAGFQGVSPNTKEITTLGRGGSDTSAVAMASYLKAERCEILKDVEAVYTADPKLVSDAKPIPKLNYKHLLNMTHWGAKVLHYLSVEMAAEKEVPLYVGPASVHENQKIDNQGTLITSDFNLPQQQILAVNSFSEVLEIHLGHQKDFNQLNLLLNQNQIGKLSLLFSTQDYFYTTAPQEILDQVKRFSEKQSFFELQPQAMCAVSVTCSQDVDDSTKRKIDQVLEQKKIPFKHSFLLFSGVHYFLERKWHDEAVRCLHQLVQN